MTAAEQAVTTAEQAVTTAEQKANGLQKPTPKTNGATVEAPKITMKVNEKDGAGWILRFREKVNGKTLDLWESPGGKRFIVCNPITDRKGVNLLKTDDFAKAKKMVIDLVAPAPEKIS